MLPPGRGPAAAPARPPVLVRREGRGGIRRTGTPPRVPMRAVRHAGFDVFGLRCALGEGVLLRQLTRRHDPKAQGLGGDVPVTVLALHLAEPTLPLPVSWGCVRRPARLRHEAGQGGLLASPGFARWTDGTGARDERAQANPVLQTQAPGPATLGLPGGDNPADPVSAQRETFLNGQGRFPTITPVAITNADTQR
jgi:hypothetical protein